MCWGRIYGSEFQAEKQCELLCVNLLRNHFQRDQQVILLYFCSHQSASHQPKVRAQERMEVQREHLMRTSYIKNSVLGTSVYIAQLSKSLYDVGIYSHTEALSGMLGKKSPFLCL